jgi:hypothetical protein
VSGWVEPSRVPQAFDAFLLGAMDAAENGVAMLHAMTDYATAAMRTHRREGLDLIGDDQIEFFDPVLRLSILARAV